MVLFPPLEGLAVAFEKQNTKKIKWGKCRRFPALFCLLLGSVSNAAYLQARHTDPELIPGTVRQHCQHWKNFTHLYWCVWECFYCGIPPSGAPQSFSLSYRLPLFRRFPTSSAIQWQFFIALYEILQPSSSSSSWPDSWQKKAPRTPFSGGGFREQMIVKHEIVLLWSSVPAGMLLPGKVGPGENLTQSNLLHNNGNESQTEQAPVPVCKGKDYLFSWRYYY